MIKKSISFIIVIFILLLFYQMGVNYFKSSHKINYTNRTDNNIYEVEERYIKNKELDYYFINVKYKDKNYLFDIDNHFNKQAEIIKSISLYNENDITCLALNYKNNYGSSAPICYKDNILTSFVLLKDKYNFTKYLSTLKNPILNNDIDKDTVPYDDITINLGYLDDENILVYAYKRIVLINKDRRDYFVFSNYDIYKNVYGYKVGKYYLAPKVSSSPVIEEFISYNIETGKQKDIELSSPISKQLFINGIYDNKLYIFDKSNLRQYSIDPEKLEFTIVGNSLKEGINVINGKKESTSIYNLKNDVVFTNDYSLYRNINYDKLYDNPNGKYIVYEKNGKYYKVYKEDLSKHILILENENITNFHVEKDNLYYLKDTVIYKQNDYMINPIITRNEFKYNKDRIFDIYIK